MPPNDDSPGSSSQNGRQFDEEQGVKMAKTTSASRRRISISNNLNNNTIGPSPSSSDQPAPCRLSVSALLNASPAPGMWVATGAAIAHAPNLTQLQSVQEAKDISFNAQGQNVRTVEVEVPPGDTATGDGDEENALRVTRTIEESVLKHRKSLMPGGDEEAGGVAGNGAVHHKHNWTKTVGHGLVSFWKFFITPTGFLITIYGLNIVAWGAMLFFLLLHAAPAMNYPDNGDADDSPRKIWLEISSQILNALFCVTAFGLAPWRLYDLWHLLRWRLAGKTDSLQLLAEKNIAWFRLEMDLSEPCLTASGDRCPATKRWKLDVTVWLMAMNTFLQAVLCFFMWHYNRIDRPTWATGVFIGLGCGVAMFAGVITWWEGRKVKIIEGPALELVMTTK